MLAVAVVVLLYLIVDLEQALVDHTLQLSVDHKLVVVTVV
jgi:hypothetical protein